MKKIAITGGAGFIGAHVVHLFVNKYSDYQIYVLDNLTYAGNLENLKSVENASNYNFVKIDICDRVAVIDLFEKEKFDGVIHLAAESHVDRSIESSLEFVQTNIIGTINLMDASRKIWQDNMDGHIFYHISTDEVYGSLDDGGLFLESTPYDPKSPYSASKASSDHFVRAYQNTHKLPIKISNCSNNYGPYQFPEKLIPLFLNNIRSKKPLPVYGKGDNVRDWLYVEDHARAIDLIYHQGELGETYNIGGFNEWKNIDLIHLLCDIMDEKLDRESGESRELITYVTDRKGHDLRYAIDASKINKELGWEPSVTFEEGLNKTVDWYLNNLEWLDKVTSGAYREYYDTYYTEKFS